MANESRKRLWPDEDEWIDFFREYLCGHPELAEHVAHIWVARIERLFWEPCWTKAQAILDQAPRSTIDAAYLSVYPVLPARVPALPAVAFGTGEAGGRARALAQGVDREDEGVHRRSEKSKARIEGLTQVPECGSWNAEQGN